MVVRIPAGATNIDVRQHSYSGKPEDDNYLGKTTFPLQLTQVTCLLSVITLGLTISLALAFEVSGTLMG